MDSVLEKSKEELLQERRAKLAKWKLKKAQKQQNQENVVTNKTTIRDNDEAVLDTSDNRKRPSVNVGQVQRKGENKTKKKKQKKSRVTFDTEDDYGVNNSKEKTYDSKQLFNPNSVGDNMGTFVETDSVGEDTGKDPLEMFMNNLQDKESSVSTDMTNTQAMNNVDDVVDDDDTSLINNIYENNEDTLEHNKYRKIAKMKSLKNVMEVTYDSNDLEPFQKQFYNEPEELKNLSADAIEDIRLQLDNIKIKGKGCPCPISRWSQLGLNTFTMELLENTLGFKRLTPIQAQAIPAIMSGRDVIGISKTGSGKTISYLLPLIRNIKAQRGLSKNETGPVGLILAPTRELALQIHEEILKFTKDDNTLPSICCTGGSELKRQINDLKKGVKIVVATPGRFIDLLTLNNGRLISTKRVTFVVMDEADRLFDLGFEPQITQIMRTIRPDKQCVLFSATFPNKLKKFALRVLKEPLSITINSRNMVNENVEQRFEICDNDIIKFDKLEEILDTELTKQAAASSTDIENNEKIIIFVSSQQICDLLSSKLETYDYEIFAIHAGKPYQERVLNLEKFKKTQNGILLCTEVLSRGLNVPEVSLVIIYNAIKTFAQYVHTTGRTARGTHHGKAISLILPDELASAYIIKKAIREDELSLHDSEQIQLLYKMSNEFEEGMNTGKFKLLKGFGGKGLENIDAKREEEGQQRDDKAVGSNHKEVANAFKKDAISKEDIETDFSLPKLEYEITTTKESDNTTTCNLHINVNDLPQLVRWELTKNATLAFIKNETGCSITTRGKYYPPGKASTDETDEPPLYLLIEAHDEKDIRLCIQLLEEKVKDGVKKVEYQTLKSSKF